MTILVAKFLTHFTTAVVYFFTALAIGAIAIGMADFWPIVFGSNIQILATILSPTIAGEGARDLPARAHWARRRVRRDGLH